MSGLMGGRLLLCWAIGVSLKFRRWNLVPGRWSILIIMFFLVSLHCLPLFPKGHDVNSCAVPHNPSHDTLQPGLRTDILKIMNQNKPFLL